jgi:hypothetical protein
MNDTNERLPFNEAIAAARVEARRRELVRQKAMHNLALNTIDQLEEEILHIADLAGITERTEFLSYIQMMMGNRVIERRIAP